MEIKKLKDLTPDSKNANRGTVKGSELIQNSLRDYGAGRSILIDKNGRILAGNKTVENAGALGMDEVIVVQTDGKQIVAVQRMDLDLETDAAAKELSVADNRSSQVSLDWDVDVLKDLGEEIDLTKFWAPDDLEALLSAVPETPFDGPGGGAGGGSGNPTLAERFGVPPFSVLDARQGYWQDRKKAWLELGIKSELGRGDNALDMSATMAGITDPAAREAWNSKRRNGDSSDSKATRANATAK